MVSGMNAGKLDRRIVIERATTTTNAFGEAVLAWAPLVEVWAHVMEIPDGEVWRASEIQATISKRFQIRHSATTATVNPKDRLEYQGKKYDINRVKELGRRVGLEITAAARAD
jgi:SPP1 family predicted phage head-tail adaptor